MSWSDAARKAAAEARRRRSSGMYKSSAGSVMTVERSSMAKRLRGARAEQRRMPGNQRVLGKMAEKYKLTMQQLRNNITYSKAKGVGGYTHTITRAKGK